MKRRILFLTSLVCMCGAAHASDCTGAGCNIEPIHATEGYTVPVTTQYGVEPTPDLYIDGAGPMTTAKLLSIKPVEMDNRRPLWDGTDDKFKSRAYDKTVSRIDGAPVWDDSISSYRDKDFHDWYLDPTPAVWKYDLDAAIMSHNGMDVSNMFIANMDDAAQTMARVEELLAPQKPSGNLWTDENVTITDDKIAVIDTTTVSQTIKIADVDECPFDTDVECEIWRKKPMMRENVSTRSPTINQTKMDIFIDAVRANPNMCASEAVAEPLMARYKMLMRTANSCCTDGMVYKLKHAGASGGLIYKFLADDANFYGFGSRCLMITDAELDEKYPNTATAAAAADVRNGCLCRNRTWFNAMLAPFVDAYNAVPEFQQARFNYTYVDGLGRTVTTSVNTDVQNVLKQLAQCP